MTGPVAVGRVHRITVMDGSRTEERFETPVVTEARETYRCLAPLFKNGRHYEPGELIELTPTTAGPFLAIGEIEEHTP